MRIFVPNPCAEKWEEMSVTQKGRFCSSCQKEVIDFTQHTPESIQHVLQRLSTTPICGRFNNNQLTAVPLKENENYTFDLVKVAALVALLSCSDYSLSQTTKLTADVIELQSLTLANTISPSRESIKIYGVVQDTVNNLPVPYAKIEVVDNQEVREVFSEFDGHFTIFLSDNFWSNNKQLSVKVKAENYEDKTCFFSKTDLEKTQIQEYDLVIIVGKRKNLSSVGVVVEQTMGVPLAHPYPVELSKTKRVKAWIFHPFKMIKYRRSRR